MIFLLSVRFMYIYQALFHNELISTGSSLLCMRSHRAFDAISHV